MNYTRRTIITVIEWDDNRTTMAVRCNHYGEEFSAHEEAGPFESFPECVGQAVESARLWQAGAFPEAAMNVLAGGTTETS